VGRSPRQARSAVRESLLARQARRFGKSATKSVRTSQANGLSKLFLTIAAAFAEAERDRIRERIAQVKADQKARGRYLGGKVPFGFRRSNDGKLVPHEAEQEAIADMIALRSEGKPAQGDRRNCSGERASDQPRGRGGRSSGRRLVSVMRRCRASEPSEPPASKHWQARLPARNRRPVRRWRDGRVAELFLDAAKVDTLPRTGHRAWRSSLGRPAVGLSNRAALSVGFSLARSDLTPSPPTSN
jgi:Resolvase, N terminal domain